MAKKPPAGPATMGRPRLIDAAAKRKILASVRMLGSFKQAAARHGIHYNTLYRAAKADATFGDALDLAREQCISDSVRAIRKAGSDDWKAHAWFLERTFTARFGRKHADSMTPEQVAASIQQAFAIAFAAVPEKTRKKINTEVQPFMEQLVNAGREFAD
jgi:hypothetical protein